MQSLGSSEILENEEMTEMESFTAGFSEAARLISRTFFQPGPLWAILAYVAMIVGLFGLSLVRFALVRYHIRRYSGKVDWTVMIFSLLKWVLVVPGWFMLWFCVMNGVVNGMDICIIVFLFTLAVYIIVCISAYIDSRKSFQVLWNMCMRDDPLIEVWQVYLRKCLAKW